MAADEPSTGDVVTTSSGVSAIHLHRDGTDVIVTHHVDEIPSGITHAMMLRQGNVLPTGLLDEVLTSESLSDCFGLALHLERRKSGRFSAWALH